MKELERRKAIETEKPLGGPQSLSCGDAPPHNGRFLAADEDKDQACLVASAQLSAKKWRQALNAKEVASLFYPETTWPRLCTTCRDWRSLLASQEPCRAGRGGARYHEDEGREERARVQAFLARGRSLSSGGRRRRRRADPQGAAASDGLSGSALGSGLPSQEDRTRRPELCCALLHIEVLGVRRGGRGGSALRGRRKCEDS